MGLQKAQRDLVAEKLMDTANLSLGALVFGQLVSDTIHYLLLAFGILVFGLTWQTAVILKRKEKRVKSK